MVKKLTMFISVPILSIIIGDNSFGGTSGVDLLLGMWGDDEFFMSDGVDWVYGGTGSDKVNFKNALYALEVTITDLGEILVTGGGFGVQDHFFSIEKLAGTNLDDVFVNNDDPNFFPLEEIDGEDGDDTFDMSGKLNEVDFHVGSVGGAMNLVNIENLILTAFDDTVGFGIFGLPDDPITLLSIDGGDGVDTIDFTGASAGIDILDLAAVSIERVLLTGFADYMELEVEPSSGQTVVIDGGGADDDIYVSGAGAGVGGRAALFGGAGMDALETNSLDADIYGGRWRRYHLSKQRLQVPMFLAARGDDDISGEGVMLFGGAGSDTITSHWAARRNYLASI